MPSWSECEQEAKLTHPSVRWPSEPPQGWNGDGLELPRAVDLALARWARAEPSAQAAVVALTDRVLRRWMERTRYPASLRDDAVQEVSRALFVPTLRLDDYGAQGPLEHWLTVTSVRLALNLLRGESRSLEARAWSPDTSGGFGGVVTSTPELKVLRADHKQALTKALDGATQSLSQRDRALLSLRFGAGTEVDALAQMYRVHRVTMSRWLAAAQEQLSKALLERLEVPADARTELGQWLGSHPELSLARLLAKQ